MWKLGGWYWWHMDGAVDMGGHDFCKAGDEHIEMHCKYFIDLYIGNISLYVKYTYTFVYFLKHGFFTAWPTFWHMVSTYSLMTEWSKVQDD